MKVLVTGGSGRIGMFVLADLIQHGHEVINADRVRPTNPRGPEIAHSARFINTDVTDVGEIAGAMVGCDAVIHLGAIPSPYGHADEVVFANNVTGTFAVFQAASLLGIKKVVYASSISAYGTAWAPDPFGFEYAPVDEAHPFFNHDCYGLSKEIDELTAMMFHRKTGMQAVGLRFHWVAYEEEARARAAELAKDPLYDNWWRLLWGWVDVRDAATICRLGIEAEGIGCEAFLVTGHDTCSATPTEELIRAYSPSTAIRTPIAGTDSPFSIDKARRLLGYNPVHTWR
jgi:nucleoside-diphosphate-sugar epimerase